jgi:hypothetical protein
LGSALETTVAARISSPPSSRTPSPGTIDPLAVEGVLHPLVVDVAVQGVGDRLLEQDRHQLGVVAEPLGELVAGGGVALPGVALGAGPQGQAQPVEQVLVGQHPLDVALGEAVGAQVGHGPVVVGDEHLVAVALQAELVHDRLNVVPGPGGSTGLTSRLPPGGILVPVEESSRRGCR